MKVFFTGHVGRDAVNTYLPKTVVTNFSVATQKPYPRQEETQWVECSIFNKENVSNILVKGKYISVVGELTMETYTSKAGEEKTKLKVTVLSFDVLKGGDNRQPQGIPQIPQPIRKAERTVLPHEVYAPPNGLRRNLGSTPPPPPPPPPPPIDDDFFDTDEIPF